MSGSRTTAVLSSPATTPTRPVYPSAPHELLRVFRHSDTARLPFRSSDQAAGYDLHSAESKIIPVGGRTLVDTHLSIVVPEGTYGCIAPQSGLASKFGLTIGAGVIDRDYRGKVYVLLFNFGEHELEICVGDRITQLILERVANPLILEVDDLDSIPLEAPASSLIDPSS